MWWASSPGRASHPNPEAPRCLPCDFDDSKYDQTLKPFNAPKGCPCTAQLLCETDERGIFNQYCDVPKAPMSTYSMHGGAGGIISIGMLRAVSLDYMEKCVKSLYSTGICSINNTFVNCVRLKSSTMTYIHIGCVTGCMPCTCMLCQYMLQRLSMCHLSRPVHATGKHLETPIQLTAAPHTHDVFYCMKC